MKMISHGLVVALAAVAMTAVVHAANVDKALADTESRRKAAENGLREIKKKSPAQAEEVRAAYSAAATRHNTWLEQACQGAESAPSSPPDTTVQASAAASALVDWVALRNRALELPVMTSDVADTIKKGIVLDLTEIAGHIRKIGRAAPDRKSKELDALKERLRWKSWESVS
jgi:hypothetical protein